MPHELDSPGAISSMRESTAGARVEPVVSGGSLNLRRIQGSP
jgi:hypothetical protein